MKTSLGPEQLSLKKTKKSRVVTKRIVFQLRISFSQLSFFLRETFCLQSVAMSLECGINMTLMRKMADAVHGMGTH